jgi:hypothetical protein
LTLENRSEFIVVEVRIRCHFEHKLIGVVRGVELLRAKIYSRDAEGGLFTRVKNHQRESGDYRRGFADGCKIRTETFAIYCKNKGMWRAGCIADYIPAVLACLCQSRVLIWTE